MSLFFSKLDLKYPLAATPPDTKIFLQSYFFAIDIDLFRSTSRTDSEMHLISLKFPKQFDPEINYSYKFFHMQDFCCCF